MPVQLDQHRGPASGALCCWGVQGRLRLHRILLQACAPLQVQGPVLWRQEAVFRPRNQLKTLSPLNCVLSDSTRAVTLAQNLQIVETLAAELARFHNEMLLHAANIFMAPLLCDGHGGVSAGSKRMRAKWQLSWFYRKLE